MNRTLKSLTMAAAAVLTLGVSGAFAEEQVAVKVPFEFRVGKTPMPAGDYAVTKLGASAGMVRVSDPNRSHSAVVAINHTVAGSNNHPDTRSRVTFRCGEAGCTLAEVWTGGDGSAVNVPKATPADRERIAVIYAGTNQSAGQ